MKILRRVLLAVLCIALIVIVVGFMLPRKVHVERSLVINASQKSVFKQINTLKNWVKWSPWLQMDSTMQLQFSGPVSGVGANYKWLSHNKNVGKGSVSIISSVPANSLQVIMDFGENGKSTGGFRLVKENSNTNVTWSLDSDLGMNPLSRWFGLFSDHMIGPDLEQGLYNLDQLLEDRHTVNGYKIIDIEVPARVLISVRDTASPETVTLKLAKMYNSISLFLKFKSLSPTGSPIAIFHHYTNRDFDIEAGIPISSVVEAPQGMNCSVKVAQKTIMIKYFGSYKLISEAYGALQTYIIDNELQITGPAWEEYISNPHLEADSTLWQTNIYYPLN